jgi:hypothetical protein
MALPETVCLSVISADEYLLTPMGRKSVMTTANF